MKRRPFIILALLLWLPALAAPTNDSGPPADILAVRNIEIIFHTAGSVLPSKDLDLMMSLFADDAVLTDSAHDNKVYRGKDQVRTYWADVSGPFRPEHHWIGYTPAMRIKSHVTGDTGTLDFECVDERGRQHHRSSRLLVDDSLACQRTLAGQDDQSRQG